MGIQVKSPPDLDRRPEALDDLNRAMDPPTQTKPSIPPIVNATTTALARSRAEAALSAILKACESSMDASVYPAHLASDIASLAANGLATAADQAEGSPTIPVPRTRPASPPPPPTKLEPEPTPTATTEPDQPTPERAPTEPRVSTPPPIALSLSFELTEHVDRLFVIDFADDLPPALVTPYAPDARAAFARLSNMTIGADPSFRPRLREFVSISTTTVRTTAIDTTPVTPPAEPAR